MSFLPTFDGKYEPSLTEQSHKDATDINKILRKAQKAGGLAHLQKYGAAYGDLSGYDFFEAQIKIAQGNEIFEALPSEIRREFSNNPANFFSAINGKTQDELREWFPQLAEPGRQFPLVNQQPRVPDQAPRANPQVPDTPSEPSPPPDAGAPE